MNHAKFLDTWKWWRKVELNSWKALLEIKTEKLMISMNLMFRKKKMFWISTKSWILLVIKNVVSQTFTPILRFLFQRKWHLSAFKYRPSYKHTKIDNEQKYGIGNKITVHCRGGFRRGDWGDRPPKTYKSSFFSPWFFTIRKTVYAI